MARSNYDPETLTPSQIARLHAFREYLFIALFPAARRNYTGALDILQKATDSLQRLDGPTDPASPYVPMIDRRGDDHPFRRKVPHQQPASYAYDDRDDPYSL